MPSTFFFVYSDFYFKNLKMNIFFYSRDG